MPRLKNPNVVVGTIVTAQDKTDLAAALAALGSAVPAPTFDEIRAAMPVGKRARFTDGMLAQTAQESGFNVATE